MITLVSCSSVEDPLIAVELDMGTSEKYQEAEIGISAFWFLERSESGNLGGSIIQQWEGVTFIQDLTIAQITPVFEESHWELTTIGVKPQLNLSVFHLGEMKRVDMPYIEFIELEETVNFQNDSRYLITISMDIDNAIIDLDGQLVFDWSHVSAEINEY